jgi:hypothetical protein
MAIDRIRRLSPSLQAFQGDYNINNDVFIICTIPWMIKGHCGLRVLQQERRVAESESEAPGLCAHTRLRRLAHKLSPAINNTQ